MPIQLSGAEKDAIAVFVARRVARHCRDELIAAVLIDVCGGCGLASATIAALQTAQVKRNILIRSQNCSI
jgi:hypothetical protein